MQHRQISPFEQLLARRRSHRHFQDQALTRQDLTALLTAAQGLTSTDGKRSAPSAHALHPLHLFLLARDVEATQSGLHAIDATSPGDWQRLHTVESGSLLASSLADDTWLEEAPAVIVVAADIREALGHFADQSRDGLRGQRYVDFEAGAAIQNLYLGATEKGIGGVVVMGYDDSTMRTALGLPSLFQPVALFCVGYPAANE